MNKGSVIVFLFKSIPSISQEELQELLIKKATVIDVREPNEYQGGHIPGVKNVPLATIANYQGASPVYVVCQSGMRSKKATGILVDKGIEAYNVKGGMMSWQGTVKKGLK